jgi:glycosyltransferase involved in cell wall biosynthesis
VNETSITLEATVAASSIRTLRIVAWRDLDDPEAGGSELYVDRVAAAWAAAGLDVELRTSSVPGASRRANRHGYRVLRRGGRYEVFAQVIGEGFAPHHRPDAVVDVWNGMPFFSPVWFHGPRLTVLHHVHGEMWSMTLPPALAAIGDTTERRLAPLLYRTTPIATLSHSSSDEIVERLRIPPGNVHVVEPGIDPRYTPAGPRSADPLVVAVGRLVPVKRYDVLLGALAEAKKAVPALRAVIVGEGYERPRLEETRRALGAEGWIDLFGHIDDRALLALYRSAWLVASASLREGWGMTLTEAAACATPSVATDIAGHRDAVEDGTSGLLVGRDADLGAAIARVLSDDGLRERLGRGAQERSERFRWPKTAASLFQLLDPGGSLRASRAAPPGSR